jgi:hypothetical protein
MSRDGFALLAVTGIALATLASFSSASATHLEVDGGVLQYAVLDGPPAPTDPPGSATCGESSQFDNVIVGSAAGETLHGTPRRDIIAGLGGDDVLYGDSQDDCILGGDGKDELHGDNGQDRLFGGQGDDVLFGGNGQDVLHGGLGDDHLDGSHGPDQLRGGAGTNTCVESNGPDSFTDCASVISSAVNDGSPPPGSSAVTPSIAKEAPATAGPALGADPPAVTDSPVVSTSSPEIAAVSGHLVAGQPDSRLNGVDQDHDHPNTEADERDETSGDADAEPAG